MRRKRRIILYQPDGTLVAQRYFSTTRSEHCCSPFIAKDQAPCVHGASSLEIIVGQSPFDLLIAPGSAWMCILFRDTNRDDGNVISWRINAPMANYVVLWTTRPIPRTRMKSLDYTSVVNSFKPYNHTSWTVCPIHHWRLASRKMVPYKSYISTKTLPAKPGIDTFNPIQWLT